MQTRDRLGWMLSGILLGVFLMLSCSVVGTSPTAQPSVVDAAPQPTQALPPAAPTANTQLPPDSTPSNQQNRPTGQNQFVDAYSDMVASVYDKGNPSVVRIDVESAQGQALGTGFIISTDGYIVTNNHVAGSSRSVIVNFIDGEAAIADLVGADADADLAVIKVREPETVRDYLVPAELGDSSEIRVGDVVVAIGNPFGKNRTATAGIISAVRAAESEGGQFSIPGVLQTDAAINPGNSGGPLFNSRGQVIGVNTFILDPSGKGANIGIGFSVPINLVKRVAPELINNGKYTHPYIGVEMNEANSLLARQNGLPSKGVYVSRIVGSPAADSDLQKGDVIVAIDGQRVLEPGDVISYLEFNKRPGDTVTLTVATGNGQAQNIDVRVAARPSK